ncbi:MAG: ORF6N domain-containing protein [Elusimicrobia bacterium]|nr:ORF6N domain-containing protein [Elusimicrobiota bacterium]
MGLPIGPESIERRILLIRGFRVMLDRNLATLYGVATKALNRAVKRNAERFPDDFMFRLTATEWDDLKCQFGASSWGGDRRALPCAFTEHGVAMLSSVLGSQRAIQGNIAIVRTFVKLRDTLALHKELSRKLQELETRIMGHDVEITNIFDAIRELTAPPKEPPRRIGFQP